MSKPYDARRQALLMAVELADFDLRADLGMADIDSRQCDILLEERRSRPAGHNTDLGATDMNAIAVAYRLIGIDIESDELVARMFFPFDQRRLADEIIALRLERHGEADAGFERIGLIGEFIIGEDQSGLDAQHVERFKTQRRQATFPSCLPHGIEHGNRILGVAENLITELARIAGARHDDRHALEAVNAPNREAEPFELAHRRLRRRGPYDLLEQIARLRALHGDIVQLVGR